MTTESLRELRTMTVNLPPMAGARSEQSHAETQIQDVEVGTCLSWPLLDLEAIAVAKWFLSQGTIFPEHTHSQREWIIVYSGSLTMHVEGQPPKRLLPGTSVVVEPKTLHYAIANEDTWCVGIIVPRAEGYPPKH